MALPTQKGLELVMSGQAEELEVATLFFPTLEYCRKAVDRRTPAGNEHGKSQDEEWIS